MLVDWNSVKEDYARKDARILELETKLKESLGLDPDYPSSILDGKKWHEVMCKTANKRTVAVMEYYELPTDLNEYSCAVNVLDDLVNNICI